MPQCDYLRQLDISGAHTCVPAPLFPVSVPHNLRVRGTAGNCIQDEGACAQAKVLPRCVALTKRDVQCKTTVVDVLSAVRCCCIPDLSGCTWPGNHFGVAGAKAFAAAVPYTRALTTLGLSCT